MRLSTFSIRYMQIIWAESWSFQEMPSTLAMLQLQMLALDISNLVEVTMRGRILMSTLRELVTFVAPQDYPRY
ncbi:hypothetical protein TWF696_003831 [Orbilia brochopaga]|uniref:Uncharacterized protein n=1 Tax=Orbilia brochopaga TaxID=3140254 RepID=A0AAV9V6Y1_9PEZI